MIAESYYWKKPLLAMAKRIEKAQRGSQHWDERRYVRLEKDIFIGFYSIRKLFEAPTKVTDAVKKTLVQLHWHANRLQPVPWHTSHRIEEHYDLETWQQERRSILYVANLIIHSFIFIPALDQDGRLSSLFELPPKFRLPGDRVLTLTDWKEKSCSRYRSRNTPPSSRSWR